MNKYIPIITFFLLIHFGLFAQMNSYSHKRELKNVTDEWHQLELPDNIFSKLNSNLSDIRIYGLTENKDTLEVPYLLDILKDETQFEKIDFTLINRTRKGGSTYFTFMVPTDKVVNHIDLDFNRSNFDWRIDLEGSHDQKEWFSVRRNYRIVGISNSFTDYKFTRLYFEPIKYQYLRVKIRNSWFSFFNSASVYEITGKKGVFRTYEPISFKQKNNKEQKSTELNIVLEDEVALSELQLKISDKVDFVRPISIEYLSDSTKTEKGYIKHFRHVYSGTLSSFEDALFKFHNIYTKHLKVKIKNYDNLPLSFESANLKGNIHRLRLRLPKAQKFFITYGDRYATTPQYDLKFFEKNIPEKLAKLTLGEETTIDKKEDTKPDNDEDFQVYLWIIIVVVGGLLGFFVIRMMQAEKERSQD